jgi:MFS transporter, MHS family, shikimate and dehydroshikimate transport protein
LAAPVGGGLVPIVAAAIVARTRGATWPISLLIIVLALLTMLAVFCAKETAPTARKAQQTSAAAGAPMRG